MVAANFERCLANVLQSEGGFSNDPHDPGGATMHGVIQSEYDAYRHLHGLRLVSVRYISEAEIRDIYRTQYWDKVGGDELDAGLDYCVFDAAVNSGVSRALYWLEESDDIDAYCAIRLKFLLALRTWKYFGKGWARRVESVKAIAERMAAEAAQAPASAAPNDGVSPDLGSAATSEQA